MSWPNWDQTKALAQAGGQGCWVAQVIQVLGAKEVSVGPVEMGDEEELRESASHKRKGMDCNGIQHQTLPDTLTSPD